jgi:cell division septation protein DedD
MANSKSPFRFDHREMTVIFSLFIFTSLLMFTVGIVVGKGVSQSASKPNSTTEVAAEHSNETSHAKTDSHSSSAPHTEDTSVSTNSLPSHLETVTNEVSDSHETAPEKPEPKELAKGHEISENTSDSHHTKTKELELIPEKSRTGDVRATLADLANTDEVNKTLKNPKIQALIEDAPKTKRPKRTIASHIPPSKTTSTAPPKSFPEGKYTVQIGSYPSQADAALRLEQLRSEGFPFAYLSTKELGDKKEPWYRVWLGYFTDAETAKLGGELLQQRGEVKSYLVRKTENQED